MRRKKLLYHRPDNSDNYRLRANIVKILFIVFVVIVSVRLFYIQIIKGGYYDDIANEIYTNKVTIYARRGNIKDRKGKIIVTSRKTMSLGVEPVLVKNREQLIRYMKKWHADMNKVNTALTKKRFEWVKDDISPALRRDINRANIRGTYLKERYKRTYPSNDIGINFIGLSKNGKGRSGIEYMYNDILEGKNGWEEKHKRPWGSTVVYPGFETKEPQNGKDVILTIDWDVQIIAEELLAQYVKKTRSQKGTVLIVNPNTGEIIAMANYPEKDTLNDYILGNYILEYAYEPGSVIKPLLLSYMFDDPQFEINEEDTVADSTGIMVIGGRTIRDHDKHGYLNLKEALIHSSNVAFAQLALDYGANNIYAALKEFGFGMKTFVDYKGESPGIVRRYDKWRKPDLATIGYGYGFMATLMQVVMAYSVIANGGWLLEPIILRNKSNIEPVKIRRVISTKSANRVKDIMIDVVEKGTATKAKIENLKIAGKTGTAHKLADNGKGYSNSKYIASFVGIFPADNPKFVIGVMLDEPSYRYRFGGSSSAPLFRDIVKRICDLRDYRYILEGENENKTLTITEK